jgi:hypothetical protein
MFKKFASISHSNKIGYCIDGNSRFSDYRENAFLRRDFRMFDTYGDGLVQHSPDIPVSEEYAIDFLESLAAALLDDDQLAYDLVHKFNDGLHTDGIKFAAGLVYNEAKDAWPNKLRYFSVSERKVTRSESKRHDKRYTELRSWHDGTPQATFNMLTTEYADGLTRWQQVNTIREWYGQAIERNDIDWVRTEPAAVFLKWFKGSEELARDFHNAFDACKDICESVRLRRSVEQHVKYHREYLERKAAEKLEAAAAQAMAQGKP